MNNDRFLTRVWDKQEKKMIYPNTEENSFVDCVVHIKLANNIFPGICHFAGCLLGVNNKGFFAIDDEDEIHHIEFDCDPEFKDRFIPMQCTGFREDDFCREDGKLCYEFDIIKSHMGDLFLIILQDGCWVANLIRNKKYINKPTCDLATLEDRFTIIGNKFDNPELLEENNNKGDECLNQNENG